MKGVVQDKKEEYFLDNRLECYPIDEVNRVFNIALMCLETEPSKRPNMSEVLKMLEKIKQDQII